MCLWHNHKYLESSIRFSSLQGEMTLKCNRGAQTVYGDNRLVLAMLQVTRSQSYMYSWIPCWCCVIKTFKYCMCDTTQKRAVLSLHKLQQWIYINVCMYVYQRVLNISEFSYALMLSSYTWCPRSQSLVPPVRSKFSGNEKSVFDFRTNQKLLLYHVCKS